MLGLFGIFGRSDSLKALDQALRDFDVHPRMVPEAVKLATVRLLQNRPDIGSKPRDSDYKHAAELLCYALLGPDQFIASNSVGAANRAEQRLEDAIAAGDGLDASLILLSLHAGIIHPKIAERFDVEPSD